MRAFEHGRIVTGETMNAALAAAQAEHASGSSTVSAPSTVPPISAEAVNSAMIRTAPGTVMVSSTAGTAARTRPRTIVRACAAVAARTTAITPAGTAGRGWAGSSSIRVTSGGLQPGQRGFAGPAVPVGQPPAPGQRRR